MAHMKVIHMSKSPIADLAATAKILDPEAELTFTVIADLKRDPELSCRARGVNAGTVAEYAEALKAGATFPPVVVFTDAKGSSWLADGFHRTAAAELAGLTEIAAEVRQGGRREALLHAASANSSHGLRRTNADKRKAALLVLTAYPKWSDRKVAEAVGVHNETVAAARKRVTESVTPDTTADPDSRVTESVSRAIVDRLAKSIGLLFAKCPDERRSELRARLDELFAPAVLSDEVAKTGPETDPTARASTVTRNVRSRDASVAAPEGAAT